MEDDKIKYEDLISPDDSIKVLIEQLTELNKTYGQTVEVIKAGAKSIVTQLKSMNAATAEGRAEIDEASFAAGRLERAQKELKFAMSETGKEVAWLKNQIASQNKMTVEQRKYSEVLIGSYNQLKSELKEQISLWKSLSQTEREGTFGQDLLNDIVNTRTQLTQLDESLKAHVNTLSAVEKAEQKLNFLRSAEGQRLLELKKQINEVISAHRATRPAVDEYAQAVERLNRAQSAQHKAAISVNMEAKEAEKIAKLQVRLLTSAEGSYNKIAAQYELNKIKLNAMSGAEREATEAGKQLEKETLELYMQMIKLQEATGNHRLSVGNYKKSWDGLGNAVTQVIRELPAAAVSLNTFFLGISNNIPILVDEINKLRAANKAAVAEGRPTESIIKKIASSLLGWNTLLVIGLTVLSSHGKQIIQWVIKLAKGRDAVIKFEDAIKNVNKELEKTNDSYGQNIVTVKKLAQEWNNLSSKKEQIQWIKDNKSEFDKLDISVRNVNEAENIFAKHTADMVEALRLRAKAAAAMKLAADKYEEALRKQVEAEQEEYEFTREVDAKGNVSIKRTKKRAPRSYQAGGVTPGVTSFGAGGDAYEDPEKAWAKHLEHLYDDARLAEKDADVYFDLASGYNKTAAELLKLNGIENKHKEDKKKSRTPRERDLTDQIWRNDLQIRKKYELSLSELQRDEFKKRKIEAIDQANATIREMQEKFRKNEVFLSGPDGKYKDLTPKQKSQIENQQKEIAAIVENTRKKLAIDLQNMEYEQEVDKAKKLRQVMDWRLDNIAKNLEEEKQLRLKQLEEIETAYSTKGSTVNGEAIITSSMTPEQLAAFQREREKIIAEYDKTIYELKTRDIDAQLELVKKGSDEEIELLKKQNELARQLALSENRLKPAEQRQDEGQINALYDRRRALISGRNAMTNFDEAQAAAEAEFNAVKRNENQITKFKLEQERDRWKKQIELAKDGAIDWSDAQMKEAEAMIKQLERKIKEAGDTMTLIGEKGLGGALLTKLGFDDDQIKALEEAVNIILDNIKSIVDAEVEAAEKAVELAEKRVEAAQNAYDAEVEGRNKGYANNVATAKKELQQEKKNQAKKQKILEEAQRRQQQIETISQIASLVTASANIWAVFSKAGFAGPGLAIAAIAAMWASFAAAKIRAAQLANQTQQEYGQGGLEFLSGGSHASGHDVDLATKNSKGKNMRAEGGEALAIINRRNARKYRKILPDIVESLNKGIFEDKFAHAFKAGEDLNQVNNYMLGSVNLARIEKSLDIIKENSEEKLVVSDGMLIIKRGNITQYIKL